MARTSSLSIDSAWNAVALEERIELISRAHAQGILAAICCISLVGATAYGFDKVWLLGIGLIMALFVFPLFSSVSWRKNKAATILQYLAVRSVARRYAYGLNVTDLDTILLFRGYMRECFGSVEEEMLLKQHESVDLDANLRDNREVWITLMRGALVLMSEKPGGAKLEFSTIISPETVCGKPKPEDNAPERAVSVNGAGVTKGRRVVIWSDYPGALYVLERQIQRLVAECVAARDQVLEMVEKRKY